VVALTRIPGLLPGLRDSLTTPTHGRPRRRHPCGWRRRRSNRIKKPKRQTYGQASFELPRKRYLLS
jgi:hypothetical protein